MEPRIVSSSQLPKLRRRTHRRVGATRVPRCARRQSTTSISPGRSIWCVSRPLRAKPEPPFAPFTQASRDLDAVSLAFEEISTKVESAIRLWRTAKRYPQRALPPAVLLLSRRCGALPQVSWWWTGGRATPSLYRMGTGLPQQGLPPHHALLPRAAKPPLILVSACASPDLSSSMQVHLERGNISLYMGETSSMNYGVIIVSLLFDFFHQNQIYYITWVRSHEFLG